MQANHQHKMGAIYPWTIWILGTMFYAYEFFLRVSPSVMVPDWMQAFRVDAASLAVMAAFYYYAYSFMQIPAGVMVDRFGPRRMLTLGVGLVVAGTFVLATAHNTEVGSIARLLQGIGSAFAFVGSLKLITTWFPPRRFAMLAGMANFLGYMGAAAGGAPFGFFVERVGWRHSLYIAFICGAILLVLIWFVVRDRPKNAPRVAREKLSVLRGLKSVIKRPQSWYNGLFAGLMVGPTSTFAALWGVPYLVHVDHISSEAAAGAVSMIFVGVAVGSPLFGILSDKIGLRRMPLIFAALGALLLTLVILYVPGLTIPIIYILCFMFGFMQSSHVLNFAIAHEINRPAASGAAIGMTNMATMLGGAIFQPFVGVMLDWHWHGQRLAGVAQYSISDYHFSFLLLPVSQGIALLLAIFAIRETYCKPKHIPVIGEGYTQV